MQISKKSWHYWLNKMALRTLGYRVEEVIPKSLCGYFWHTVFAVIYLLLVGTGMVTIGAILYTFIGIGRAWSYLTRQEARKARREAKKDAEKAKDRARRLELETRLDRGEITFGEYWDLLHGVKPEKVRQPRKPGLFRSWLKARKEKVCPRLEFIE